MRRGTTPLLGPTQHPLSCITMIINVKSLNIRTSSEVTATAATMPSRTLGAMSGSLGRTSLARIDHRTPHRIECTGQPISVDTESKIVQAAMSIWREVAAPMMLKSTATPCRKGPAAMDMDVRAGGEEEALVGAGELWALDGEDGVAAAVAVVDAGPSHRRLCGKSKHSRRDERRDGTRDLLCQGRMIQMALMSPSRTVTGVGFFDQGNIRKDEVFRITDQDTRSRAAALQEKRERAVVRRLARRAKLEVFMQETDRERARVHRQTEERAVHGVPAYMQPTFASIVREVDEQKRRSARAEAASRGPVASEGAAYLQPTFASRERNLQRGTALTRGLGRGHADTTRGRTQNHQARIREATKLAQFRENFERAEQYVAESVALHHELADNRLQIDTSPRNTKNPNSSRFDRKYYRRHEAASDPVELAKKKLEAACYGYGRNWSRLFQALDADGSGSLDAEEFRLGLRRVARVPRSQLSDRDIRHLFTAIDASSNGRMEATEFVEFMNLQMTPSWEIVQQREREQKLVVESGVKLQQAESTTESDSEEQFRLHHSPQTPQPRKHDRLGMQPQPQYPLAFTAPDEDQARMIQENAVALGSGVPPGSDPCCDLLSPAVAAQLSHRQRASVEALLKHLTKADYDILQHCVHKMIEPATRRAYAQNSHSPRGREKVIHSGEQRTQPVLGPDQLNAVLQYVQQTVDGINKVAKSVQARAALDGPRSPASSRVQTPSPNSTSMFNQQHGQASFPHGDNDADTPHSTSSSERVQSPGTGLKSSPSFILQNLDVLTDMIAADVVESSLLHSAAKMVVDAQGLHPSSSNRAHDSSTGGLRRLLFDMSQLEESEKRLAQRWGFDRSFREGGLPIETRRHAHGFDQPHSEDRGSATQVLRKLENAGLVPTVSRALPDGTITAFPEHWEAELEARQAAEVLAQEEDKSMARILHHVRQYKRAKVGLPTPSSSLSRQAYNAIFKPDANMDDFDGDAQQSDGENQHHQRPLQLADVLLRPELLEHLSGQILEEILAENAEEVAILMDDMTTSVIETL
eukprot:INCI5066.1.p1 GENE.INCI5066.1~~INCI5066.1.p1  ORF type:complete len:1040 (+),score=166.18 INCI5066.1:456-3575(+)